MIDLPREDSWCGILLLYPWLTATLATLVLLKVYAHLSKGKCLSDARMHGKTVIITGANRGIGFETALDLAKRGARIIMACKDLDSASKARDDIVRTTGSSNIVIKKVDMASLSSVREFAAHILVTEKRLDVLVNNAGAANLGHHYTKDKLEVGMQVNHFGAFLLTNLLLGLLKKSAPSRIVMVASVLHLLGWFRVEDMNRGTIMNFFVYCNSKLANILMANELSRKLQGTGVTINSLHPGVVNTDVFRNLPPGIYHFNMLVGWLYYKSPVEGAQTTIFASVDESLKKVSGKYFMDCQESATSPFARNVTLAKRLWDTCEELVHLRPEERHY